jgi:hypothetical protein
LLHHLFKLLVQYARQYRGSYLRGGDERQWAIKHLDLYKKICVKNDRIETDLTITREHMESTMDFLIAYELNKFDDDLDNALHNVVPN